MFQISSWVLKIQNFKILNVLDIDMVHTKVAGINAIYNFIANIFFIEVIWSPRYLFYFLRFQIQKFRFLNDSRR